MRPNLILPLFTIIFSVALNGCNHASRTNLQGIYFEGATGTNACLIFNREGMDIVQYATYNPATGRVSGLAWMRRCKYSLVGDTVRVTAGVIDPKVMAAFGPIMNNSAGGDTFLLKVTDSGQSLEYANGAGVVTRYIRQSSDSAPPWYGEDQGLVYPDKTLVPRAEDRFYPPGQGSYHLDN